MRRGPLVGRWTIRARLTLTYSVLMVVVASLMVVAVYLFMSYAPSYDFPVLMEVQGSPPETTAMVAPSAPSDAGPIVIRSKSDVLTTLLISSLVALVVIAGLAAAFGWFVTGRLLRPLHGITTAARLASTGRLDHRIARPGPADELKVLADTFDVMLARLEQSMHTYQRFAANASHELRTPLATTQALLDLAITDPDDQDVRALAASLRTINSRSIDTVDALFDLADAAETDRRREPVELRDLAGQALTAVTAEAAANRIELSVSCVDHMLAGDPVLLRQLLINLLQNAVRYNHPGGTVRLTTVVQDGGVTLQVSNSGPIVPAETVPMLTEPFYRGAGRAATGARRGHGLGLALASTIVTVHGGKLSITANPDGGLTVTVLFEQRL